MSEIIYFLRRNSKVFTVLRRRNQCFEIALLYLYLGICLKMTAFTVLVACICPGTSSDTMKKTIIAEMLPYSIKNECDHRVGMCVSDGTHLRIVYLKDDRGADGTLLTVYAVTT